MKKLSIAALCCLLLSCGQGEETNHAAEHNTKASTLHQLSWVLGNWYMETPDGIISEEWTRINDSLYTGFGMMKTAKGDTVFSEQLKLVANIDGIWYMPTVSNQNNGEEVRFKEKPGTGDSIVFENPGHDFPQRIVYRKLTDSTMIASIEGTQSGKERKEEFSYKKR